MFLSLLSTTSCDHHRRHCNTLMFKFPTHVLTMYLTLLKHSQIKKYVIFKANFAINSIVILRDLFQNDFTAVCRRYDRETHVQRH